MLNIEQFATDPPIIQSEVLLGQTVSYSPIYNLQCHLLCRLVKIHQLYHLKCFMFSRLFKIHQLYSLKCYLLRRLLQIHQYNLKCYLLRRQFHQLYNLSSAKCVSSNLPEVSNCWKISYPVKTFKGQISVRK